MKFGKKSLIGLFLTGVLISGTVASADVLIGDGYNGAKQALKHTTKTLSKKTDSFTASFSYEFMFDGDVRARETSETMYDLENQKRFESHTAYNVQDGDTSNFWYEDSEKTISHSSDTDSYYQTNYTDDVKTDISFIDPFDEDIAKDVEKVADAFVSNMKDYVQTKDTSDGGKVYFGSVSSSQMPVFANALSSFFMKYAFLDAYNCDQMDIPKLDGNLYCNEVSGKISQNADGLLDSIVGSISLIGTEKSGEEHSIQMSFSVSLYDINDTTVSEPEVDSDKLIVSSTEDDVDRYRLSGANIGTYRGSAASRNGESFEKLGNVQLEITSVADDYKTAEAHLTADGIENADCDITLRRASDSKYETNYVFDYTTSDGESKHGMIETDTYVSQFGCNLLLAFDVEILNEDSENGIAWNRSNDSCVLISRVFD